MDLFALDVHYLLATVVTGRADVMTQMIFAGCWLNRQSRCSQEIMGAMHTALGWGFFILLNCHAIAPWINLINYVSISLKPQKDAARPSAYFHSLLSDKPLRHAEGRLADSTEFHLPAAPAHPDAHQPKYHQTLLHRLQARPDQLDRTTTGAPHAVSRNPCPS